MDNRCVKCRNHLHNCRFSSPLPHSIALTAPSKRSIYTHWYPNGLLPCRIAAFLPRLRESRRLLLGPTYTIIYSI